MQCASKRILQWTSYVIIPNNNTYSKAGRRVTVVDSYLHNIELVHISGQSMLDLTDFRHKHRQIEYRGHHADGRQPDGRVGSQTCGTHRGAGWLLADTDSGPACGRLKRVTSSGVRPASHLLRLEINATSA